MMGRDIAGSHSHRWIQYLAKKGLRFLSFFQTPLQRLIPCTTINDDASLTPLPPQLRHHLLSPRPHPHPRPHQLMPPTTANQPHRAQTTTEVVWALGNLFFQVLFFS